MVYSLTFNTQTQIEQAIGQADHNSGGATARLEAQPGACTSFAIARWPAAHPSAWLPVLQGAFHQRCHWQKALSQRSRLSESNR